MSLGDFFPDDLKDNFARRNIDLGSAILIKIPDFEISYDKFIVVVAKDKDKTDLAYVVINSEVNLNVNHNKYLKSLNIPIDKARHSFLDRDSFVDCSRLREFPIQEVVNFLIQNPKRAVGNVNDEILRTLHLSITSAKTIDMATKKKFGFI